MPSLKHTSEARPRFGRISTAVAYSGLGRSSLYIIAGRTPGLFKKNGAAILVDFDVLDEVLDQLPLAKIKPGRSRHFDEKAAAACAERDTPSAIGK